MKKTLFFLAISTFLSTGNLKAQKTWDFASSPWADNSHRIQYNNCEQFEYIFRMTKLLIWQL